jgi:hypothetical protein
VPARGVARLLQGESDTALLAAADRRRSAQSHGSGRARQRQDQRQKGVPAASAGSGSSDRRSTRGGRPPRSTRRAAGAFQASAQGPHRGPLDGPSGATPRTSSRLALPADDPPQESDGDAIPGFDHDQRLELLVLIRVVHRVTVSDHCCFPGDSRQGRGEPDRRRPRCRLKAYAIAPPFSPAMFPFARTGGGGSGSRAGGHCLYPPWRLVRSIVGCPIRGANGAAGCARCGVRRPHSG